MNEIDPTLTRDQFVYGLPDNAIAQAAIEPRDASRLLRTSDLSDHRFTDLPDLLVPGDLLVVNETRVRRARLRGRRRGSGGEVELLVLDAVGDGSWECLCRPARRLRPGVDLDFDGLSAHIIEGPTEGRVTVHFTVHDGSTLDGSFDRVGEVPLPPYFHGRLADPERYQTMFARPVGSAAAPTAALHFTPRVLESLAERGVQVVKIELRIGLDTFRPITEARLADHMMHTEAFVVPEETSVAVAHTKERGGRVFAVGTTVTRTLETAATAEGVSAMTGFTDLFITPGYRFRVVDGLITNFHVPGSTLVALVAAALGDRWRLVYDTALERGYRFLSFGDAMLIELQQAEDGGGVQGG